MRSTTNTPLSGWLNKLTTAKTFGGSRWQSRYFVLLDSEMRYYRSEHSITASRTINLRNVSKVMSVSFPNRAYCFKLEPTLYYQSQHLKDEKKVWTIECQSQYELESWVDAINDRLLRLCFEEESQPEVISPSLQPFSTPEQKRQEPLLSLTRAITSASNMSNSSSGSYTTTATETSESEDIESQQLYTPQRRPLNRSRPTISRRRGVLLCPLDICTIPGLETSDMLSSSSSKEMSPVNANEEPDEEENSQSRQANKVTVQNAYVLDTTSPTFALYKERFHL